jgi:hypothetical protein
LASKGVTKSGEAFCMACGATMDPGSARCESCYSQMDHEVLAFKCPRCDKVLELGREQCPECYMKFKAKAVKPSDAAEDARILEKLIEAGRAGKRARDQPDEGPTPSSVLADEEVEAVSALLRTLSELTDLKSRMATDMVSRLSGANERLSRMMESGPAGLSVEALESEIGSVAIDLESMGELVRMATALSNEVSRVFSMPGPSGLASGHEVSLPIPLYLSGPGGETDDLSEREEQLRKREDMVDLKIKAYAQKKKELDMREAKLKGGPDGAATPSPDVAMDKVARKVRAMHELLSPDGACDDLEACLSSFEGHLRSMVVSKSELEQRVAQLQEGEEEIKALLKTLDGLLGQLPTEVVERFSKSDEFKLYERVLDRLRI